MKMKRNTLNKIADWTEKLKDWTYKKKPSNKYLRIAYYSLTGLIPLMFITPLFFIGFVFVLAVSKQMLFLLEFLINFSYTRIIMILLACLLILLMGVFIGYFEFGDD